MRTVLKAFLRRNLPAPTYRAIRSLWIGTNKVIAWPIAWVTALLIRVKFVTTRSQFPALVLFFGFSPGDDLLCTAVLRELRNRGQSSLLMISNYPELFEGNTDTAGVRPAGSCPRDRLSSKQVAGAAQSTYAGDSNVAVYRHLSRLSRAEFKEPIYAPYQGNDRSVSPSQHIIGDMCASVGIKGRILVRPYFHLSNNEKEHAAWASGRIVIQSSGMGALAAMKNKQWCEERFQGVVDALRQEFRFIQLGSSQDPPLDSVEDLRGATSIRETASILHNARLYVGTVGFLMHLARAVECPSVIVYGGREAPWQSGYVCNTNLFTPLPCAPCWRWNSCDFDRKCMKEITISHVVSAIRKMIGEQRNPLAVESIELA